MAQDQGLAQVILANTGNQAALTGVQPLNLHRARLSGEPRAWLIALLFSS